MAKDLRLTEKQTRSSTNNVFLGSDFKKKNVFLPKLDLKS